MQQAASTSSAEDEAGTLHLTGASPPLCSGSGCPLSLHSLLYLPSALAIPCPFTVTQTRRAGLGHRQVIARSGITTLIAFTGAFNLPGLAIAGNPDWSSNL